MNYLNTHLSETRSSPSNNETLTAEEALLLLDRIDTANSPGQDHENLKARVAQDLERLLASVLKLEMRDLSADKSWLDYGLDSIASTELATLFTKEYKISLPPTIFFEFQNLDSFVEYLLKSHKAELRKKHSSYSVHLATPTPPSPASRIEPPALVSEGPAPIESLWAKIVDSERQCDSARAVSPKQASARVMELIKPNSSEPSAEEIFHCRPFVQAAQIHTFDRVGGGRIECATYGEGPPILLLGGLVMHFSVMWQLQLEAWGARHRLIMFHMPGTGGATLYDGITLESLADDVAAVLDAIGFSGSLPVLGYSFGGVLAQLFALRHKHRCSTLAICVSTSSSEGIDDFLVLMKELQKSPRFMEVNRGWQMSALPVYGRAAADFDFRDKLGELDIPALVVSATDDRYMTPAYAAATLSRLPNAQSLQFQNAGHLVGFTHHREFNKAIQDFWTHHFDRSPGGTDPAAYAPASDQMLQLLEDYVRIGEQGHTIMLSPVVAQAARLIDIGLNSAKDAPEVFRSYFLTSQAEALDAAIRFARHLARNQSASARGQVIMIDPTGNWARRFNPMEWAESDALVPGIEAVDTIAAAEASLHNGNALVIALIYIATPADTPDDLKRFVELAHSVSAIAVLVDLDALGTTPSDWLSFRARTVCDIVVLGKTISGSQIPSAAMVVRASLGNPWTVTPNEGYVRHPMANLGFAARVIAEHLSEHVSVVREQTRELRRIANDPEANYSAHLRYGNHGYARVARMHGFDARFYEGRGVISRVASPDSGPTREIVDCLSNVGTCPRGLNPLDIIAGVARAHDRQRDYWEELRSLLKELTGIDAVLQTPSYVAALDAGLALGLSAARGRTKIVAFSGGAAFSLASGAVAHDLLFDSFRAPFQPLYPHVLFVDPKAPDAQAALEEQLSSGEVALVWLETIQVEGNATRALPANLVETVERLRERGGYLIGVDETQTSLWTGRVLHSAGLIPRPDIVVLGTAVTDGLVSMGAVLARQEILERVEMARLTWFEELRKDVCQFSAHLAVHSLRDVVARDLMAAAREQGSYFKASLQALRTKHPIIRDVRGEGLLLTIELDLVGQPAFVQQSYGYLLWGHLMRDCEDGVAVVVCPLHNNCIRLAPPLTISHSEIDRIIKGIDKALSAGIGGVLRACAAYCEMRGDMKTAKFIGGFIPANDSSGADSFATTAGTSPSNAPRVCIIGAGVAGISMAKALKDKNVAFQCYEARDQLGGIWAYDAEGKHTSTWANLNMNTPKGLYQFADMPMPEGYPDYPSRQQVTEYLESYVDKNDLRRNIHLNCRVLRAERGKDGKWDITLENGVTSRFDALAVANGHHNQPVVPDLDISRFAGSISHSKAYRSRHEYRDKRVMVVGIGNSGAQIAVDISHDAAMTFLSIRRGVYVLPHYLFGMRIDKALGPLNAWWVKKILPYPLHEILLTATYKLFISRHRNLGMPRPDHWMMSCLPTMSENLANRIGDGKLEIVAGIERIEGTTVHLKNGRKVEVDSIIYATGYRTTFPFLDSEVFDASDNKIQLYKRIFHPRIDNMVFIGLFQAITWGFLDIMERQAQLAAQYLAGEYALPSVEHQLNDIAEERRRIEREYVPTLRNQYYLHGPTYMHELSKEMRRGRNRSSAAVPASFVAERAR